MYDSVCQRCGVHGAQSAPLRLTSTSRAPHSDIVQPNWLFDVFLVRPEVESLLVADGFDAIQFAAVLEDRTGLPSDRLRQMHFGKTLISAEVACLPKVTCRPNNEESSSGLSGPNRYPPDTAYCGRTKSHPPTSLSIPTDVLRDAPDIFHTAEWFGSGGVAYHITVCSQRFVDFIERHNLRGVRLETIQHIGQSSRTT